MLVGTVNDQNLSKAMRNYLKQRIRITGILLFLAIAGHGQSLVDGFMKNKKGLDLVLSYSNESYDEFFFGNEKRDAPAAYGGEITIRSVNLYAKYGLSEDLEVAMNIPYILTDGEGDSQETDQTYRDFQDLTAAVKWRFYQTSLGQGRFSAMTALGFALPLTNYEDNEVISIGNRSNRLDPRILAQYQFKNGLFTAVQAAYSFRNNDVPNASLFETKLGYAANRFYVDAFLASQISDSDARDIGDVPFNETRVNYLQVGANFYYQLMPGLGVAVGYGRYVEGRNLGLAQRFSAGIVGNLSF